MQLFHRLFGAIIKNLIYLSHYLKNKKSDKMFRVEQNDGIIQLVTIIDLYCVTVTS